MKQLLGDSAKCSVVAATASARIAVRAISIMTLAAECFP